jgi:hypothetical protein
MSIELECLLYKIKRGSKLVGPEDHAFHDLLWTVCNLLERLYYVCPKSSDETK